MNVRTTTRPIRLPESLNTHYRQTDAERLPQRNTMSQRTVCDFCDETIQGTPLITSTEKDGQKFEFCSAPCFIGHCNGSKS